MALSDVIKKKQATEQGSEKAKATDKPSILDDVRVVIAVIILACIALIVLIVFGARDINNTMSSIDKAKVKYKENQEAIANLRALQERSGEYKEQIEKYEVMISKDPIDQMQIMIDVEKSVEAHNCKLTELSFGEIENTGLANQIAVNAIVKGSYSDIMSFCHDVVSDEVIRRIDTIDMTGTETEKTARLVIVEFSR